MLLKKGYGQSVISDTLRQLIEDPDYSSTRTGPLQKAKKARGVATAGADRAAKRPRSRKK